MIAYFRDGTKKRFFQIDKIREFDRTSIILIKATTTEQNTVNGIASIFEIDLKPFQNREDIEISSHYIDIANQLTLNFTIPIGFTDKVIQEESTHFVIKDDIVFVFASENIDKIIQQLTELRYDNESLKFNSHLEFLVFQLGTISDYYADMVEMISHKIRVTYNETIQISEVYDNNLDLLTHYNFSNFLLRESVSEFQRVILLLRRKFAEYPAINDKLDLEINDLSVVSEHIQYNFERVNDLKSNINSKIELEQNKIFKTLTIITVCVSIPTLIAGIYGMNFENIPELNYQYGYIVVMIAILLSSILPLIYFKKNKWF